MDNEPDFVAVELVAIDGHRMPLKKDERIEAIKLMTKQGIPREVMAWRLCITVITLKTFTDRKKIKLTPRNPPAHWTSGYIANRNEKHRRLQANQKRETRQQNKTLRETI